MGHIAHILTVYFLQNDETVKNRIVIEFLEEMIQKRVEVC